MFQFGKMYILRSPAIVFRQPSCVHLGLSTYPSNLPSGLQLNWPDEEPPAKKKAGGLLLLSENEDPPPKMGT